MKKKLCKNKQSIPKLTLYEVVSILLLMGIQRSDKFWFALNLQKLTSINA